eukprot:727336-Amphidinium_carterae.2
MFLVKLAGRIRQIEGWGRCPGSVHGAYAHCAWKEILEHPKVASATAYPLPTRAEVGNHYIPAASMPRSIGNLATMQRLHALIHFYRCF